MKKTYTAIAITIIALATYASSVGVGGFGKVLTATTTPAVISVNNSTNSSDFAAQCSVVVTGSGVVYFMPNTTTNNFVQTNAIPVTAGFPYTFRSQGKRFYSVCYATASGSSEFIIAFE